MVRSVTPNALFQTNAAPDAVVPRLRLRLMLAVATVPRISSGIGTSLAAPVFISVRPIMLNEEFAPPEISKPRAVKRIDDPPTLYMYQLSGVGNII